MDEKRRHFRTPVTITAEVTSADGSVVTLVAQDLSKSGAFLAKDGNSPLPALGAKVHLVIKWPLETGAPPVEVDAEVMRHTDEGIGVSFEF